jgi:hypothetical protein
MVKDVKVIFGQGSGCQPAPIDEDGSAAMWKKKSIFWEIRYWQILEVRNAVDVMHLTKKSLFELASITRCLWHIEGYN